MTLILAAELLLFDAFPAALAYAVGVVATVVLGRPLWLALLLALVAGAAGEVWLRRRCCRDSQGEWVEPREREVEVIW